MVIYNVTNIYLRITNKKTLSIDFKRLENNVIFLFKINKIINHNKNLLWLINLKFKRVFFFSSH
jgi:hypothetical protein